MPALRALRTLCLAALAALSVTSAGCTRKASVDEAAEYARKQILSADTRLRGTWVLQSFTPATTLEPMLAAMLQFQFGRLVVNFDGARMVADSPGLHVDRRYQINEANGDQFKVTAFDDQGVPYEAYCTFVSDQQIEVVTATMPWRGRGMIVRTAAGMNASPIPNPPL